MPRKISISKEKICEAALKIVDKDGEAALNARALAAELSASTQPIFSNFKSMDELRLAVFEKAYGIYFEYIKAVFESGEYPPYKSSGMGYVRFARERPNLFKFLFMRDRSGEGAFGDDASIAPILEILKNALGISESEARQFHTELWIATHGIATMVATKYIEWDDSAVSNMLSDIYNGLKLKFGR